MFNVFVTGFLTGLGLIVAIGAQNAFVLRQGLARRHVFVVCTICAVSDAALIAVGVAGLGAVIAASTWLTLAAAWGGAAFVTWFGARALWNALGRKHRGLLDEDGPGAANGLRATVATTLAFSLLNPHVYLDTVVLLGGIGAQYPFAPRLAFLAGAVAASIVWFYGIGFGATLLAPMFRHALATRLLDGFVAAVMFTVAWILVAGVTGL